MLRDVDEVILDGGFQRVADLVAALVTSVMIAHGLFVMIMLLLFYSAWIVITTTTVNSSFSFGIALGVLTVNLTWDYLKFSVAKTFLRNGTYNPLRLDYVNRIVKTFGSAVVLNVAILQHSYAFGMIFVAWPLALYFSACRINPPPVFRQALA